MKPESSEAKRGFNKVLGLAARGPQAYPGSGPNSPIQLFSKQPATGSKSRALGSGFKSQPFHLPFSGLCPHPI